MMSGNFTHIITLIWQHARYGRTYKRLGDIPVAIPKYR